MTSPKKLVAYRLTHASRLQRARSAQLLGDLGLFPGQETVLKALTEQNGRTMGDLALTLRVRPPTVSKTIGRLAAQGLVERRPSVEDARIVHVFLSDEGRERAKALDALAEQLEDEMTEGLDGKDKKRLRKLLKKVERNLSKQLGSIEDRDDDPDLNDDLSDDGL
jgi:DNA-binding MarR family transcriptional regulator